jgi:alpha-tubulin suppressor-like RCC1 family protein
VAGPSQSAQPYSLNMQTSRPPLVRLFSLGSNGSGQLGIGHQEDVSSPQPCIFDEASSLQRLEPDDEIVKVVAGGNHTLVLFASGAVFAAGSNEFGPFLLAGTKSRKPGQYLMNTLDGWRKSSGSIMWCSPEKSCRIL